MVLRQVHGIDRDERADGLRQTDDLGHRRHRADGVRGRRARHELGPRRDRVGERVEVERHVVLADVGPPHGRAGVARREDPRPDVRVVVEPRHHDLVARPERAAERPREMEQHRRRVLSEHDLVRVAARDVRPGPACAASINASMSRLVANAPWVFDPPRRWPATASITVSGRLRAAGRVGPHEGPPVRAGPRERREPRGLGRPRRVMRSLPHGRAPRQIHVDRWPITMRFGLEHAASARVDEMSPRTLAEDAGFDGVWVFDHFKALYARSERPGLEGELLAASRARRRASG